MGKSVLSTGRSEGCRDRNRKGTDGAGQTEPGARWWRWDHTGEGGGACKH